MKRNDQTMEARRSVEKVRPRPHSKTRMKRQPPAPATSYFERAQKPIFLIRFEAVSQRNRQGTAAQDESEGGLWTVRSLTQSAFVRWLTKEVERPLDLKTRSKDLKPYIFQKHHICQLFYVLDHFQVSHRNCSAGSLSWNSFESCSAQLVGCAQPVGDTKFVGGAKFAGVAKLAGG